MAAITIFQEKWIFNLYVLTFSIPNNVFHLVCFFLLILVQLSWLSFASGLCDLSTHLLMFSLCHFKQQRVRLKPNLTLCLLNGTFNPLMFIKVIDIFWLLFSNLLFPLCFLPFLSCFSTLWIYWVCWFSFSIFCYPLCWFGVYTFDSISSGCFFLKHVWS